MQRLQIEFMPADLGLTHARIATCRDARPQ